MKSSIPDATANSKTRHLDLILRGTAWLCLYNKSSLEPRSISLLRSLIPRLRLLDFYWETLFLK
jgi:hypothetical protein